MRRIDVVGSETTGSGEVNNFRGGPIRRDTGMPSLSEVMYGCLYSTREEIIACLNSLPNGSVGENVRLTDHVKTTDHVKATSMPVKIPYDLNGDSMI